MLLFVCALLIGWMFGFARGGRTLAIARIKLHAIPLLLASCTILWIAMIKGGSLSEAARLIVVGTGYALLAVWMALNASRGSRGLRVAFAFLCIGWMLNSTVVLANQGMPVSEAALARAGLPAIAESQRPLFGHLPASDSTYLRVASDVIPVPVLRHVMSPGDVVILLGFATIIAAGMRLQDRRARASLITSL